MKQIAICIQDYPDEKGLSGFRARLLCAYTTEPGSYDSHGRWVFIEKIDSPKKISSVWMSEERFNEFFQLIPEQEDNDK